MADAQIVILDEVHCRVSLDRTSDMAYLIKKYALPVKNHFFNPRFKIGAWDGRIRFFQHDGTTYNYLLPEIAELIVRMGYEDVDVIDNRKGSAKTFAPITKDIFADRIYPDTGEPISLADHQVRCVNALLSESNGIILAATGAGKSLMTAALARRFEEAGLKTLIIVPSLDLIANTRDEMIMAGIKDVGEFSGTVKDIDHQHVVSTWQSLKNVPMLMKDFTAVLVDEVHTARSAELKKLLIEYGQHIIHRYGMTGTLPDDACERMTVHTALGPVREEVPASELIAIGWLSTLEIEIVEMIENLEAEFEEYKKTYFGPPITMDKFKKEYFPDFASERTFLTKHTPRIQWIATHLDGIRRTRGNTFVLVGSIDLGKKLAMLTPNSHFVHGADKTKVRKQAYDLFKESDDVLVFATVGIASTGINIKRIFNLCFIDMGKSFIRTIQTIGRGLRKAHDKSHLQVYDITSDLKYSQRHRKDRVKYYKEAGYPVSVRRVDYTAM